MWIIYSFCLFLSLFMVVYKYRSSNKSFKIFSLFSKTYFPHRRQPNHCIHIHLSKLYHIAFCWRICPFCSQIWHYSEEFCLFAEELYIHFFIRTRLIRTSNFSFKKPTFPCFPKLLNSSQKSSYNENDFFFNIVDVSCHRKTLLSFWIKFWWFSQGFCASWD